MPEAVQSVKPGDFGNVISHAQRRYAIPVTEGQTDAVFPLIPMSTKRQITGTLKIVTQRFADEIRPRKGRDALPQIKILNTRQDGLVEEAAVEEKLSAAGDRRGRKKRSVINLNGQRFARIIPFTIVDEMATALLRNLFFGVAENVEFGVPFDMLENHFKFLRFPKIVGIEKCNPFEATTLDCRVPGSACPTVRITKDDVWNLRVLVQEFFHNRSTIVGRSVV